MLKKKLKKKKGKSLNTQRKIESDSNIITCINYYCILYNNIHINFVLYGSENHFYFFYFKVGCLDYYQTQNIDLIIAGILMVNIEKIYKIKPYASATILSHTIKINNKIIYIIQL